MTVTVTRPSTHTTYTLSTDHAASSYGIPVLLSQDGQLVNFSHLIGDQDGRYSEARPTKEQILGGEQRALYTGLLAGSDREAQEMVQAAYFGYAYLDAIQRSDAELIKTDEDRRLHDEIVASIGHLFEK